MCIPTMQAWLMQLKEHLPSTKWSGFNSTFNVPWVEFIAFLLYSKVFDHIIFYTLVSPLTKKLFQRVEIKLD